MFARIKVDDLIYMATTLSFWKHLFGSARIFVPLFNFFILFNYQGFPADVAFGEGQGVDLTICWEPLVLPKVAVDVAKEQSVVATAPIVEPPDVTVW